MRIRTRAGMKRQPASDGALRGPALRVQKRRADLRGLPARFPRRFPQHMLIHGSPRQGERSHHMPPGKRPACSGSGRAPRR